MKTDLIPFIFAALVLTACNQRPPSNNNMSTTDTLQNAQGLSKDTAVPIAPKTINDTAFLLSAYNNGVFEIKASKLARRMSEHKKVKEFANMIIRDHMALDSDLATMLKQKGCSIPADLPRDLEAKMKYLGEYVDKDFEQRYAQLNIDGHKAAILSFTEASKNSGDASIRKLAAGALPNLRKHETEADSLMVFINTPRKW